MVLRQRIYDVFICVGLMAATLLLVIFPSESVSAARDGIELCLNIIVPSLFPFFVISSLIVSLGLADRAGRRLSPVMRPLFGVSGAAATALMLGFIGGYPVGARTAAALFTSGSITKTEAGRLLSFCNNAGPAFILGVVGAGVFGSGRVGLFLYLIHIMSSVTIGILFRNWGKHTPSKDKAFPEKAPRFSLKRTPFPAAFVDSVKSSFMSTLGICGFVIFFTVVIKLLFCTGVMSALSGLMGSVLSPLGFDELWSRRLLTGIIELSSGVWSIKGADSFSGSLAMAAFMLGWAGISVHCQTLSVLSGSGLKVKTYMIGKLLHAIISALLAYGLSRIFAFVKPAAAYIAGTSDQIAIIRPAGILAASLTAAAVILAFFVLSAKTAGKRQSKNI